MSALAEIDTLMSVIIGCTGGQRFIVIKQSSGPP